MIAIWIYNTPYIFAHVARQYDIFFADNPLRVEVLQAPNDVAGSTCDICPNGIITNTNQIKLLKTYEFEYPLSFTQAKNIINNAINFVGFEDGRGNIRNGFISEIRINLGTFVASFKLLSDA